MHISIANLETRPYLYNHQIQSLQIVTLHEIRMYGYFNKIDVQLSYT